MINEEPITLSLRELLDNITQYCNEFYYEVNINVLVDEENDRQFILKQSALTEAIFHILTFINRGDLNADHDEILLKGIFTDKNIFPTIVVEVPLSEKGTASLGWESGPSYVYASLLSVYLLAKENDLFFNIETKEGGIAFILEPLGRKISFYNQAFTSSKLELHDLI
jgi:hypothetical protein